MELIERICACGCGSRFRTTRTGDKYASLDHAEMAGASFQKRFTPQKRRPAMAVAPTGMVTAKDLAQALGVSTWTVHDYVKKGKIPFHREGPRSTFFRVDEVRGALSASPRDPKRERKPDRTAVKRNISAPQNPFPVDFTPSPRDSHAKTPTQKSSIADEDEVTRQVLQTLILTAKRCRDVGAHRSERELLWMVIEGAGLGGPKINV